MPDLRFLLFAILLAGLAFPTFWEDPYASERACFNVTTTSGSAYDKASYQPWTIFDVAVPKNGSAWNGSLNAIDTDIFMYAENSTHAFLFIPALSASGTQEYCVYLGGENQQELSGVGYYFYDSTQGSWTSSGTVAFGSEMNVSSSGAQSYARRLTTATTFQQYAKIRTAGMASGGYVSFGSYDSDTASKNLYSLNMNETGSWFSYDNSLYNGTVGGSLILKRMGTSSQTSIRGGIYGTAGNLLAEAFRSSLSAHPPTRSLVQADDGQILADWILMGRTGAYTENFSVSTPAWERLSNSITINSPIPNSELETDELSAIVFSVNSTFDNCSASLNGYLQGTASSPGSGESVSINSSNLQTGTNEINVTCFASSVPESRFSSFTIQYSDAESLFMSAFGADISSCPSSTLSYLSLHCQKYFRNNYAYNFSAVICSGLPAGNYSCVTSFSSNVTKNNYTMFVTPGWTTPVAGVNAVNMEHIGANFYFNGMTISNGIQIIGNYSFVYIPAQTRLRDCGVYYNSTTYCSLWSGFVLNDRTVYVSNEKNEWFSAAGYGITSFNTNYSNTTVTIGVTPITQFSPNNTLAESGIFTRISCKQNGSTYSIAIRNTLPTEYHLEVTGSENTIIDTTNKVFEYSTTLENGTVLELTGNGRMLCRYGYADSPMFIPFSLPGISTSLTSIFIKIMFVFAIVVSALVPYTLIITVVFNDMFNLLSPQHMAMVMVFGCMSSLVNAAFQSSRGMKNMVVLLGLVCGFMLALGTMMEDSGMPSASPVTSLFNSFKEIAEAQTIPDMATGLFSFAINLFVTVMLLPVVIVGYIGDLLVFINPNLAAAFAPFSIIAVAAVVYLYIKAYEVLGNKFRDV